MHNFLLEYDPSNLPESQEIFKCTIRNNASNFFKLNNLESTCEIILRIPCKERIVVIIARRKKDERT